MSAAFELYEQWIRMEPDNAEILADRGTAYAIVKDFDHAICDLERAFALGCSDAAAYSTMATIEMERGNLREAVAGFSRSLELDPNYAFAYYNRAKALYELDDKAGAVVDLKRCLSLGPDPSFEQLVTRRLKFIESAGH